MTTRKIVTLHDLPAAGIRIGDSLWRREPGRAIRVRERVRLGSRALMVTGSTRLPAGKPITAHAFLNLDERVTVTRLIGEL